MMRDYIHLNRSFGQIPEDYRFDEDTYESPYLYTIIEPEKWDSLLELKRVVILAEAGSGKTKEIEVTATNLRTKGKPAFFLRLEHLCDKGGQVSY